MAADLVERLNAALGGPADQRAALPVGAREELVALARVRTVATALSRAPKVPFCRDFVSDGGERSGTRSCYSYVNRLPPAPAGSRRTPGAGAFHVSRRTVWPRSTSAKSTTTDASYGAAGHHRPRGPRGGPQAARHVHRLDRRPRPAPPRLRGRRQLRRRGARRPLRRASTSRSTRTTRSPSSTTAAASRSRCMEKEGKPAVEVVLTVLHAGGKFGDGGGYKVSGGLHGVGVSVVNALSERARRRDPPRRASSGRQDYERGEPQDDARRRARRRRSTGTTITFLPDARSSRRSSSTSRPSTQRLRETAFLTRGLRIALIDERGEGNSVEFHYEGGIEDFVRYLNENKEPIQQEGHLLRGRERGGRGRGRDAVERLLPGVGLLVRQQHQHARGRLAPLRLPLGADPHAEQVRAREGRAQGEGREPRRRGRARGPDRGHLGEARRPAVRGPDEDQARQPAASRASSSRSSTASSPSSSRRTRRRRARSSARRSQAAQARSAARKARDLTRRKSALENSTPAGQARRLLGQGPVAGRDLRRRGRLRRRLGQAGPRPQHAGGPAAARQDPQRREEPHRQGARRTTRSRR